MKMPLAERKQLAYSAQGEMQLLLTYDHHEEVLEALLDNPYLTIPSVVNLAKKRTVSPGFLGKIIKKREWVTQYDVKVELVKNPRTPSHESLKLLKYLYRQDLQFIARDVAVSHVIRQVAVTLLEAKLEELLPGEKIALAREAVGPLLTLLLNDQDARVVKSALNNSRVRENDVVVMANKRHTQTEVIREVFQSRWTRRYSVIVALVHNPNTPDDISRLLLEKLLQQDLLRVIENPTLPVPTRMNARHMLRRRVLSLPRVQQLQLARTARREVINVLLEKEDLDIVKVVEKNPNLVEGQLVSLAVKTPSDEIICYLAQDSQWRNNVKLRQALFFNPNTPEELRPGLVRRKES